MSAASGWIRLVPNLAFKSGSGENSAQATVMSLLMIVSTLLYLMRLVSPHIDWRQLDRRGMDASFKSQ